MSEIPEPDAPSDIPVAPTAAEPARRPPRSRPPRATATARAPKGNQLSLWLILAGFVLTVVHLVYGREDFNLVDRGFAVVPLFPLLWEINRYQKLPSGLELPTGCFALLHYYVNFSMPALFNTKFGDLSGPTTFSDSVRFEGTAAVALSSLLLYAGIRLGGRMGELIRPSMLRLHPPSEVPGAYPRAVGVYAAACAAAAGIVGLGGGLPPALAVFITMVLSFSFAIGAVLARPDDFHGPWSRYIIACVLFMGSVTGLLHGMLEPLFRVTIATIVARWAYIRRFSVAAVAILLVVYVALQPAKAEFRAQTWGLRGAQEAPSVMDRVSTWSVAFENVWSGRDAGDTAGEAAVSRFLELDPVLHAFTMLPGRVPQAEGAAWANILYAPIPRILWPGKPTTDQFTLNYGVAFNLQSTIGARSTSIMLPLIVDGYWNFGWPGIVFVSVLMGAWVGVCQTMYAHPHWALKASGVAQFSLVNVTGSFALVFAGISQQLIGCIGASWLVYGIAHFLRKKQAPLAVAGARRNRAIPLPAPGVAPFQKASRR